MARTKLIAPFLLSLGLAAACSSGNDDDDTGRPKPTQDAGTDAGTDMNMDAGTNMDAGPADTGVTGPCDPVGNTGCTDQGTACVFNTVDNEVQCRTPGMAMHEQMCNQIQHDCEPGFACINIGNGPMCHRVCDEQSATACSDVTGMSNDYTCAVYNDPQTNQPLLYGVCVGINACNPAEKAAACPAGETCSLVSQNGDTSCEMSGTAMAGQSCGPQMNCADGLICVNVGQGGVCWEACDQANPCTNANATCLGLQGIDWGLCEEVMACVPYDDQCPANEYCAIADAMGNTACAPEGPNALGAECGGAMGGCMKGGICVATAMGQPATCREPCDPANDQCSQGACAMVANGWGICN